MACWRKTLAQAAKPRALLPALGVGIHRVGHVDELTNGRGCPTRDRENFAGTSRALLSDTLAGVLATRQRSRSIPTNWIGYVHLRRTVRLRSYSLSMTKHITTQ